MDFISLLVLLGLGYVIISKTKSSNTPPPETEETELLALPAPPGYNPYILNQFQEMKDVIFSADIRENRIEAKPSNIATGVYGITENQLKLHPYDSITITHTPKHLLNL